MIFLSKWAAAVGCIHRQGRLVRVVGKTGFAMKYLGGAEDKPWVSKAKKKEAGIRKRKWDAGKRP